MSHVPPIRREVVVDLDPDHAFELFTARIGDRWPLASHSVFGASASVTFADDKLVETLGEQTAVWGEVIEWQPGALLVMGWHVWCHDRSRQLIRGSSQALVGRSVG